MSMCSFPVAGAPRYAVAWRAGSVETATKRARGLVHLLRAFQLLSVHRDAMHLRKDFCCRFGQGYQLLPLK